MRKRTKIKGKLPAKAEGPPAPDPADSPPDRAASPPRGADSPSDGTASIPDLPLQVVFAEELTGPESEGHPPRPDAPAPPGEEK